MSESVPEGEILVITMPSQILPADEADPLRGGNEWHDDSERARITPMRFDDFAANVREFMVQIQALLHHIPEPSAGFSLSELEITAGISASGKLALFGIGGEAGMEGGLKFVFKRTATKQ